MAGQKFTLTFDAQLNVGQMKGALNQIQSTLNGLHLPQNLSRGLQGTIDSLNKEIQSFEVALGKDITGKTDFNKLNTQASKIVDSFEKLKLQVRDITGLSGKDLEKLFPSQITQNITSATTAINQYKQGLKEAKNEVNSAESAVNKLKSQLDEVKNKKPMSDADWKQLKTDISSAETEVTKYKEALLQAQTAAEDVERRSPNNYKKSSIWRQAQQDIELYKKAVADAEAKVAHLTQIRATSITNTKQAQEIENLNNKLTQAQERFNAAQQALQQFESAGTGGGFQKLVEQIGQLTGQDMSNFSGGLKELGEVVGRYITQQMGEASTKLQQLKTSADQASPAFQQLRSGMDDSAAAIQAFDARLQDVRAFKSRIQYFFGLNNAINLFKRAIRGAFDTIKELDKAMTETAVVTDYTVKDMWDQLPEYTKRANELGVTTKDAYESATLYFQQGLNADQAAALSVETLKMARIAGLDAAEATDRMTNALRGFNMELDTASAQRVDDVYSELAANTASNVDEISTAMTKVASLAHSANMEFETTAAFLAQIIETTRESAETAGTALKTVVARFSEVKKLVDTNQLKGQDEEGQAIDVNKVGAALRTAGIDLNKYFLGEVGLDDIFMELASKWDSLTSVQQRYIATQAAGSRQQSRFIALMQDYARMQELVGKAYNAEGASARQFEKTQDSLQSKLARLKNAWNEFLMGLANSTIVKGVVDGLTTLLNIVNKLTTGFDKGTSFILKWIAALSTFAAVKSVFKTGGFLDLLLMGGLQAGGKGALANAAVRTGLLSGLVRRNGAVETASILSGQAAETAAGNARAVSERNGSVIFGGLGGLLKKGWGGAQKLGNKFATSKLGFKLGMSTEGLFGEAGASTLSTTAAGLTGIATALAAVTAAVAAAILIYKAWEKFSPEGKLKVAKKEAEEASKKAEEAQNTYKELNSLQDTYKEKTEAVTSALTAQDRATAIEERNQAILDAIKSDGTLAQYVVTEQVGFDIVLTIDEAALAKATKEAAEANRSAQIESGFAMANEQKAQSDVYENQLRQIWIRATGQRAQDVYGVELSPEQYLKQILNSTSNKNDRARAAELYGLYNGSVNSAQKQAELTYGQVLQPYNLDAALTNKLIPMLGELFVETGKRIDTDQITNLIGMGKTSLTPLLDAWSGSGKMSELILDNLNINIDSDEFLTDTLGLAEDQLQEFATYLGIDINTLKNHIRFQAKANKEIQKNQRINIYERLLRSGAANEKYSSGSLENGDKNVTTFVDQYTAFLQGLNTEGLAKVESITAQAESLLGNKLGEFMAKLPDIYGTADFQAISNLFNKIDLDKPIQTFVELQKYAKDTTSVVGQYAQAIKDVNPELFTASNLVKSFIASADYENITEQLADFIKENEAITADNINELADSCSDLAILLDQNVTSAQALAEAFTLLETGALTFDQITDSLLKALDAGKSFETVIAEVKGWIEDFDQGNDLAEGADHVVSVLEDLQEYVDNWEFGNEPVENIYDHLFGEGEYQKFLKSFGDQFDPAKAESILSGKIERFTQLFENEGLGAIQELSGKLPGLKSLGNNLFDWDLNAIGSTTDAIKQVADSLGITEQAAESLILAWQTHIPGLRTEWNNLAFDKQVTAYANNLGNAKAITEQQLSALAAATGHTVDEIKAKLAELAKTDNINIPVIVNFQDADGNALTGDTLYNKFVNTFGTWSNTNHMQIDWGTELADALIDGFKDGLNHYDPSEVMKYFTDRGADTQQATEMANRAISEVKGKFNKEIEVPVTYKVTEGDEEIYKTETKTVTVEADTVEGLDAAVDTALQEAHYESVASSIANQDFSGLSDKIYEAGQKGGERAASAIQTAINGVEVSTIKVPVEYVPQNSGVLQGTIGASGGIVQSYASGSAANRLSPGVALTGEEGPEIVWNKQKGYAYITGEYHPQFQNLQPGDRVFNAQETRKILNGSLAKGGLIDSYASGGWKPDAGKKSSGGGGGSKSSGSDKEKTPDEWKNELDWLYNLMEDIAELERDQKAIEEQYEDYLQDQSKTGKDLYNLLIKQLGNLYTQLNHQTFALEKREQEMREFMDTTNDKDQYLWYNWQDRTLEIDWDAIDQITDEEEYKHVKELVDEAEEIQDKIDDADDAIMDITNQIQELENIWRDTFTDFEDRVYDAIVKSYQQVIDNYSELNDTLNNSNSQILDSLQKQISLQRQIRDNTKTEEEITDDEARLAYLRRDTSGGNDLAALQLEKELSEQRQNYEDTLVDQAINRLQEDNDAAAQQRQQQIDIMQAQLDYQSQNGEFNAYVRELLESAMGADGELLTNSDLVTLLKQQENWAAMSDVSKEVWDEELNGTFKEVAAFLLKQNAEENGTFYTALTAAVNSVSSAIGSYSQAMVKLGNQISSAASGGGGGGGGGGGSYNSSGKPAQSYGVGTKTASTLAAAAKAAETASHGYGTIAEYTNQLRNKGVKFATGGLSTKTGLAWLDGSPSEPEYVLNARQTDAFLKLADVLPSMMGSGSNMQTNTFGSTYITMPITLESVNPDYDVDRMVDLLKDKLYDAGSYRNVNSLSFIR